jgi:CRISPR/Cas system CSM-associated protein Csm4 (group 5 of RAMP superfamily)
VCGRFTLVSLTGKNHILLTTAREGMRVRLESTLKFRNQQGLGGPRTFLTL